ncbi:hypothetical protein [Paenibacillus radicis (ex Xue et al. 2023)]|uniref:Uncharacterized protein n=1 Tax=Paenibacillus radicis (ex Xue et al. 2023) TaxID=2972489 RepID=A0ABT1YAI1_9BACL|nr:hypothetical protein [Paenibacillus radicis (ex Xue et al. 2023)]MCR8630197.1 hypothetical protein [Paenibacillus radicis (ex Xue et al. 2023)]
MRYELIHLLSHLEDEQIMASIIQSLNTEDFETFVCYLDYTKPDVRERWLEMCNKILRLE